MSNLGPHYQIKVGELTAYYRIESLQPFRVNIIWSPPFGVKEIWLRIDDGNWKSSGSFCYPTDEQTAVFNAIFEKENLRMSSAFDSAKTRPQILPPGTHELRVKSLEVRFGQVSGDLFYIANFSDNSCAIFKLTKIHHRVWGNEWELARLEEFVKAAYAETQWVSVAQYQPLGPGDFMVRAEATLQTASRSGREFVNIKFERMGMVQ